jgi:hypothetical protein
MKRATLVFLGLIVIASMAMLVQIPKAGAEPGFWTSQFCSACHGSTSTCDGCHAHGVHSNNSKNDINLTAITDKVTYAPGEAVTVTVDGGYRGGWVRAILYDDTGVEVVRSTGSFPITLTATAPATPGTYAFSASWYGNQNDNGGAAFGANWSPDPGNSGHGEEIVATNAFDVVSAAPAGAGIGVFREGLWFLDSNSNGTWESGMDAFIRGFGTRTGSIPVVGDWNNDGIDEIGVFKDGLWLLDFDGDGVWDPAADKTIRGFGTRTGSIPVVGDWNNDGIDEIGIFKDGLWLLDFDGDGVWDPAADTTIEQFGTSAGSIPVVGDWNNDGTDEIGVFKDGLWLLDFDGDGVWDPAADKTIRRFGATAGSIPVVGDWNNDGTDEIGIFKDGLWWLDSDGDGTWDSVMDTLIRGFGRIEGNIPVVGIW